jgi:outer membrane protein
MRVSLARVLIHRYGWLFGVALLGVTGASSCASADTLQEALVSAYRSNPVLQSQRARQRGTDELVPKAKSGWRPTIIANGVAEQNWSDSSGSSSVSHDSYDLSIELSQPIFRGFKTVEGVKSAKAQVRAGQQDLVATEQDVLLDAVTAYMDIIRDQGILALRTRNVGNLQKQVNGTTARFDAGEVTTTDVSQARARLAAAQAGVAVASSNLNASKATYVAVVGSNPGKLAPARAAKIPRNLEEALATAHEINPNILAADALHEASEHDIAVAKGDLLPEISLQAQATKSFDPTPAVSRAESASILGVVTVPIYQSGAEYSAVRERKHVASQRQIEIITATRGVRQQVTTAWYIYSAAGDSIVSAKAEVAAAQKALEGLSEEYKVGSRSTIDVLNAEEDVLSARINLVSAERDRIVASYQLLATIGKLTARNLGLPGPYYEVEANYKAVKNKWFGLDAETVE